MGRNPRLNVTLDHETQAIIARFADSGERAAWVREAIREKARREGSDSDVEVRLHRTEQRLDVIEQRLGIAGATPD